jgi:hypothetical protein
MGKIKLGGYVFVSWSGDHLPRHVHVYKDGRLVLKYNLDQQLPMKGKASNKHLRLLSKLESEGKL